MIVKIYSPHRIQLSDISDNIDGTPGPTWEDKIQNPQLSIFDNPP